MCVCYLITQQMEEMLRAQAAREEAEGGVIKVLIAAARQRLAAVIRRREAWDASNKALVGECESTFAKAADRVANMGDRALRGAAAAGELQRRAAAEVDDAAAIRDGELERQNRILGGLRSRVEALQEEITSMREEAAALAAGDDAVALQHHISVLRARIESTRRSYATAQTVLAEQARRVAAGQAVDHELRHSAHAMRLAQVTLELPCLVLSTSHVCFCLSTLISLMGRLS